MKYAEQIELLSESILAFDREPPEALNYFIDKESSNRLKVYRKNIFFGAYSALADDYVGLKSHLEGENFRFLIRKYLLENRIQTPNIAEFSKQFVGFLEHAFELHLDPLLAPLAKLDQLYCHGEYNHRTCDNFPKGLLAYWNNLLSANDDFAFDIRLEEVETIGVFEVNGERYLRKA